ncbi:hypothetical protein AB7828_30805 [Tardiphaga sp. 215_C5_N2_1]|uniref:hypothetical protein n=1 Tax=Tardiphaga sp. 215_C5_N2_1 TaxID=3240774 RepID=UPI003F898884
MTAIEVAEQLGCSASDLHTALSHIPQLGFDAIRSRGLEMMLAADSDAGKSIGFLANGDVSEILERDQDERDRLSAERAELCKSFGIRGLSPTVVLHKDKNNK